MRSYKMTCLLWAISIFLLTAASAVCRGQADPLLGKRVRGFEAADAVTSAVLRRLARTYKVPVGLEVAPGDENQNLRKTISVKVENGTVQDVLNAVVRADPRYEWRVVGGVINVFPKGEKDPLLETTVRRFQLNEANGETAFEALAKLPEVTKTASGMGMTLRNFGSLPAEPVGDGPRFSLLLRNTTVRNILNKIIERSGSNYWIFFRYGDRNQYYSLTL